MALSGHNSTPRQETHRLSWTVVHDGVHGFRVCLYGKSFVSTWPIPQQTLFVWGNRGTFQTCDVAGFLGHGASLASAVYNGSLAVYFALTIVGNYTEHTKPILWKWLEPLLHFVPLAIGWSTAAVMLSLDYFNPIGWTCWIGTFPPGCGNSQFFPCTRGDAQQVEKYRWAFFHAQLWTVFAIAGATLFGIWYSVEQRERRMLQYNFRQSISTNHTTRTTNTVTRPPSSDDASPHKPFSTNFPFSLRGSFPWYNLSSPSKQETSTFQSWF